MSQQQISYGPPQYAIVLLTITTAAIHIYISFQFEGRPDFIFLLNGLGYLTLLALLYLPLAPFTRYRAVTRWVLIAYSAVTVLLWVFIGARTPVAYLDKAVEVALIVLLWFESQQSSKTL
jgi:hypothetical protein